MDPQIAGSLRSILQFGLGAAGSYLVTKGVITSDQAVSLAPEIAGAVFTIGGAALAIYSGRQHSPANLVAAVNSAAVPGVKVVRESSTAPPVVVDSSGKILTSPPAPMTADAKPELK